MRFLIVEDNADLGSVWARFLKREGAEVTLVETHAAALQALRFEEFDAVVLDCRLPGQDAVAVADFAAYRQPDVPIIMVTGAGFFSDGSVFNVFPNARGMIRVPFEPSDLAAMLDHYGSRARDAREMQSVKQA